MEALNGHSIDGRALVVNEARERQPRGDHRSHQPGHGTARA